MSYGFSRESIKRWLKAEAKTATSDGYANYRWLELVQDVADELLDEWYTENDGVPGPEEVEP